MAAYRRWLQPFRDDIFVYFFDFDTSMLQTDMSLPPPTAVATRYEVVRQAFKAHLANLRMVMARPEQLRCAVYAIWDDVAELLPMTDRATPTQQVMDALPHILPRFAVLDAKYDTPVKYRAVCELLNEIAAGLSATERQHTAVRGVLVESRSVRFQADLPRASSTPYAAGSSPNDPLVALDVLRLGACDSETESGESSSGNTHKRSATASDDADGALGLQRYCEQYAISTCITRCRTGFEVGTAFAQVINIRHHIPHASPPTPQQQPHGEVEVMAPQTEGTESPMHEEASFALTQSFSRQLTHSAPEPDADCVIGLPHPTVAASPLDPTAAAVPPSLVTGKIISDESRDGAGAVLEGRAYPEARAAQTAQESGSADGEERVGQDLRNPDAADAGGAAGTATEVDLVDAIIAPPRVLGGQAVTAPTLDDILGNGDRQAVAPDGDADPFGPEPQGSADGSASSSHQQRAW